MVRASDAEGPALLGEADRRELVRAERALAEAGQSARYVVVDGDRPGIPIGLLPVYPVARPYTVAPHPGLVLDGSKAARGWRTGCYLGSLGRAPGLVAVDPTVEPGPVRAALVREAWRLVTEESDRLDFACFPLLDAELLADVVPLLAEHDPVLVETVEPFVPITFDSFDEYLGAQSRGRRAAIRQEQRRFQETGLRIVEVDLLTRYEQLAPLLRNVELKYGKTGDVEDYANYLLSIAKSVGDQTTCLAVFGEDDPQGHDPVAFTVAWRQGEVWRLRCWGCDYARTEGTFTYFNLVVYEPLRRAIAAGVRRLVLGRGSLEAKVGRGAQLSRLTSVAVSLNR
ncbi:GNAT family N-acetyltransferase [Micromonospora sp. CPCC 205546]|uniref:peptidogalycan biosysnthesis protein n=1 Tax=Micromonospora sp. CPCC 205546 TaxID=3122397 RepID=UPI002FF02DA9